MVNVHDKARELAKALEDHQDVKRYKTASEKIQADATKKEMVEDFRKLQLKAVEDHRATGEVSEDTRDEMEDLAKVISLNQEIAEYLEAEQRFSILFNDVMKILSEGMGIDIIG